MTEFQRTLMSKCPKLPDCYECRKKNDVEIGSEFFYDKDQKVGSILKTPWSVSKETHMVIYWSAFFGKEIEKLGLFLSEDDIRIGWNEAKHASRGKICRKKSILKI